MVKSKSAKNKKPASELDSSKSKCDDSEGVHASQLSPASMDVSSNTFGPEITNDESIEFSVEIPKDTKESASQIQLLIKLKRENESLALQLAEKDNQLNESNKEIEHLHNGLKSLQSQFVQLEKENKKARHTLLELSESNTESIDEYQKKINELSEEVDRLNSLVEQLESDKEQLEVEHKVSLESSLSDLEIFRNELSDTIAELNASYTQLAQMEEAHLRDINTLKSEMAEAASVAAERELSLVRELDELREKLCEGETREKELVSQKESLQISMQIVQQAQGDWAVKHTRLQSELVQLQNLCEATEKEKGDLLSRNEALEAKQSELVSTFRAQLIELQDEAKTMLEEKSRIHTELSACKDLLNTTNEQLKSRMATLEKAKKAHKLLTSEKDRLISELTAEQTHCRALTDELKLIKTQLESLSQSNLGKIDDNSQRIIELQQALSKSEAEHSNKTNQLTESLRVANDELSSQASKLSDAESSEETLRSEIDQLKELCRSQVEESQCKSDLLSQEKIRLEQELKDSRDLVAKLRAELDSTTSEILMLRDERSSAASNEEQLNAVKSQLIALIASQESLQSENSAVLTNITDLERRYSEAVSELSTCRKTLKESEENVSRLELERDQLNQVLEESRSAHSNVKKKAVQLKGLYQQSTSDLANVKSELESARSSESMVQKQLTDLQENFEQLKQKSQAQVLELESRIAELQIAKQESESLHWQTLKMESQAASARTAELELSHLEVEVLKKQLVESDSERDQLRAAHASNLETLQNSHQRAVTEFTSQLSDANELVFTLKSEIITLTLSLNEVESLRKELSVLKEQNRFLQSDNEKLHTGKKLQEEQTTMQCQSELEDVRRELLASLLDMSVFSQGLSEAHSQLLVLKDLVNLKLIGST